MKIFLALILILEVCQATQQIPKYYTENYMKRPEVWKKSGRKQYLKCVALVQEQVKKGTYDEVEFKAHIDKCKSDFNKKWVIHRKVI